MVLQAGTRSDTAPLALGDTSEHTHREGSIGRGLVWLTALYRTWLRRSVERGYLHTSDSRLRLDLEAGGQDIAQEVAKPFWRS
jgi:hypothetical protein